MEARTDHEPTLNVQAVEVRTGVTAETLRTWERRYGWPRPRRLPNGYRAYTEEDVSLIHAVKRELTAGLSAAAAWQRVIAARQQPPQLVRAPAHLAARLVDALLSFAAETAGELLAQAHALYPLEGVLTEVIQPVLVEIGERWHAGEVTIAQEHFASNLLRDNLVTVSNFYRPRPGAPCVMIGAGPGELHDIGPLMLAVLLRRDRFNVLYLGQSVTPDQLTASLRQVQPRLLALSAARTETARELAGIPPLLERMAPPRPVFAFGGRAFAGHDDLADRIAGMYIPGDAAHAARHMEGILATGGP